MATIAQVLGKIKDDLDAQLDHRIIHQACQSVDYQWRDRLLDPVTTFRLFILQILFGNTACRTLSHLAHMQFSVAAYCKARSRLPLHVFRYVVTQIIQDARQNTSEVGRWLGHRVFHVDGTGISMPDTINLQKTFGQPGRAKKDCGFPVAHVLWMFDAGTGFIVDWRVDKCRRNDMPGVPQLHPSLEGGDILVGDRAFCSYTHLALLLQDQLHGVFRMHHRIICSFKPYRKHRKALPKHQHPGQPTSRYVKHLGHEDQLVEYSKSKDRPKWIRLDLFRSLPKTMVVRELRYRIEKRGYRTKQVTLVTTLLDPLKYPKEELVKLYNARWDVEINIRHLKQTLKMNVLRCKCADGVRKEMWVFVLVYNLIRRLMLEAAVRQKVPIDRISFADAADCLRYRDPNSLLPQLVVNPRRIGRCEPRVIKRSRDCYPLMTRPREKLKQELGITRVAA